MRCFNENKYMRLFLKYKILYMIQFLAFEIYQEKPGTDNQI